MDLVPGEGGSAALVIDWGGLLDDETEAAQTAWDSMCGIAETEVRDSERTDCSQHVLEWACAVAMLYYRTREQAGQTTFTADGGINHGVSVTTGQIRQRRGMLGPAANPAARVAIAGG